MSGAYISQVNRRALFDLQNDIFKILNSPDVTSSADDEFGARHLEGFPAGVLIALPNGFDNFANWHPVGEQLIWIQINLIFLYKPADRCDLCHTFDRLQRVAQIPVLYRTKLGQVMFSAIID